MLSLLCSTHAVCNTEAVINLCAPARNILHAGGYSKTRFAHGDCSLRLLVLDSGRVNMLCEALDDNVDNTGKTSRKHLITRDVSDHVHDDQVP